MNLLRINPENPEREIISLVSKAIKKGKIIIYPTDTVYGLGCAINSGSIRNIFEIKERDMKNPLSVAFSSLDMAERYVLLDAEERKFIEKHINERYTFVVKRKSDIPDIVTGGMGSVGIRIIDHPVPRQIIQHSGLPIITTSANMSGKRAPVNVGEIDNKIKNSVDIILDAGRCKIGIPSKVIDLSTGRILRG